MGKGIKIAISKMDAIISKEDKDLIEAKKWYVRQGNYVVSFEKRKTIYMHRYIYENANGPIPDLITD